MEPPTSDVVHAATRCATDQHCLSARPAPLDAVCWSADNLLAVAAGRCVVLVSPADLGGPRAYAPLPADCGATSTGCKPSDYERSVSLGLACLGEAVSAVAPPPAPRRLAWSPPGAAPHTGACLLAVAGSDGSVRVFGPPTAPMSPKWEVVADLGDTLLAHMAATSWRVRSGLA